MTDNANGALSDVKTRLDQIVEAVSDETLPLDDALSLYEEAVGLGMRASEMIESDISGTPDAAAEESEPADNPEEQPR